MEKHASLLQGLITPSQRRPPVRRASKQKQTKQLQKQQIRQEHTHNKRTHRKELTKTPSRRRAVAALMQAPDTRASYDPQSGQIFGIQSKRLQTRNPKREIP